MVKHRKSKNKKGGSWMDKLPSFNRDNCLHGKNPFGFCKSAPVEQAPETSVEQAPVEPKSQFGGRRRRKRKSRRKSRKSKRRRKRRKTKKRRRKRRR